jgi:hypothetical protein
VGALAEIEPAIDGFAPLPAVASSADEPPPQRLVLAIIAALAAVLVPGHTERLIDTPLTWSDLACGLRQHRPRHVRLQMIA